MGWYNKHAQLLEKTPENEFNAEVSVKMGGGPEDYDIEPLLPKTNIKFFIDVEYRSWGIKDIILYVTGGTKIGYRTESYGELEEKQGEVVVDLEKINKEIIESKDTYTLGTLQVWLDESFNVDYNSSSLEIIK